MEQSGSSLFGPPSQPGITLDLPEAARNLLSRFTNEHGIPPSVTVEVAVLLLGAVYAAAAEAAPTHDRLKQLSLFITADGRLEVVVPGTDLPELVEGSPFSALQF